KYTHGSVRSPYARIRNLAVGCVSCLRLMEDPSGVPHGRAARRRSDAAGRAWYRNLAPSGAASFGPCASDARNCGVHHHNPACGAPVATGDFPHSTNRPGGATCMIKSAVIDGVAVLTMQHGKANTLDVEFCNAMTDRFIGLRKSDIKAVVLAGQGKIFSAGVDLKRLSEGGSAYVREFLPALHRLYEAVFFHPKPLVAAVNGHAIAGGWVLAWF